MRENKRNFSPLLRSIKAKPLERELGFGKHATTEGRLMNPDGSFNVLRQSMSHWDNIYFYLITMPWQAFGALILLFFMLLNAFFSGVYCLIGIEHLNGITPGGPWHNFMQGFFFSSQTLTTVGYGHISPNGFAASVLASFESFLGLLAFALVSGLLYGRFSRPVARITFSEQMLVAPYQAGQALMFRIINSSKSELIEVEAQALMAINQREESGALVRRFYPLPLEITKVNFMMLSWTLVHAMNEGSPLANLSEEDLLDAKAEVIVLIKGIDETSQQMVHARRSYTAEEIRWKARFSPIVGQTASGMHHVLTSRVGDYELLQD